LGFDLFILTPLLRHKKTTRQDYRLGGFLLKMVGRKSLPTRG